MPIDERQRRNIRILFYLNEGGLASKEMLHCAIAAVDAIDAGQPYLAIEYPHTNGPRLRTAWRIISQFKLHRFLKDEPTYPLMKEDQ